MNSRAPTVVVIGAGIGGLTAAAYLAKAGVPTSVFEARPIVGGGAETVMLGDVFRAPLAEHALYALDRRVMRDFPLRRYGLEFAEREMPLVSLRSDGNHLVLPRDLFGARAAIRHASAADGAAYTRYRREVFGLARALRPLWLGEGALTDGVRQAGDPVEAAATRCKLSPARRELLEALVRSGAASYLDNWFEGDALKAVLAFEACREGESPYESGSALLLAWRATHEIGGLQSAAVQYRGGPLALATALARAGQDAGATYQTGAPVGAISFDQTGVDGVVLADGERVPARAVISSLSHTDTLKLLPPEAIGFASAPPEKRAAIGRAKILLGLNRPVPIAGLSERASRGRIVIAERPEAAAEAKGAALAGRIPSDLVLELTVPSSADQSAAPVGHSVVSVLAPFLPAEIAGGWDGHRGALLRQVCATIERYAPGFSERVIEHAVCTPADLAARYAAGVAPEAGVARLLSPCEARICMPVRYLYLCGGTAEPVDAVSGTAGRVAAKLALADLAKAQVASP